VLVTDGTTASVCLGDFAILGSLLRTVAGEQEQSDET